MTTGSTRLSTRLAALAPSSTLAVTARVNAMKAAGHDVIGFGAGQPDFDTPQPIKAAAIESLQAGNTKYLPTPGPVDAREAIAKKLQNENKIDCGPQHIVITNGAKQSLYMAIQSAVNTGDEVILPTPCWVSYRPMIELTGGVPVEVAGNIHNDFKITPAQLTESITEKTRAIILNSPSNPCGTMYSEDELRNLAEVVQKHPQVVIIIDEIYEKMVYGNTAHFSIGSITELADRVITINGLSKAYAMTGWRLGYLCAPGENAIRATAITRLQEQLTGNVTSFCYAAIIEALTNCAADTEENRKIFAARAALIYDLITAMPDVECCQPTGAFYLFPDISTYFGRRTRSGRVIESATNFCELLLEDAGVALVPGEDFGRCAAGHVRFSFAISEANIEEGCRRVDAWLRECE